MAYNVLLTEHARDDLKSIYEYIAFELLSPDTASGMIKGILAASKGLNSFPSRNPLYHEEPWKSMEVRFVPYKNYIIFYKVDDTYKTVTVARIMFGGRDITNQLNESNF